jgi:hypothetical protein
MGMGWGKLFFVLTRWDSLADRARSRDGKGKSALTVATTWFASTTWIGMARRILLEHLLFCGSKLRKFAQKRHGKWLDHWHHG